MILMNQKEYMRKYHQKNKEKIYKQKLIYKKLNKNKIKKYMDKYYKDNKKRFSKRIKKYQEKYYRNNKNTILKRQAKYYSENKEKISKSHVLYYKKTRYKTEREHYFEMRIRIIYYYSKGKMCCKCCGEKHLQFLAIDHKKGGGYQHRKKHNLWSKKIYKWIIDKGFPKGFQILCHNCNLAKGFYGQCPHKNLKQKD